MDQKIIDIGSNQTADDIGCKTFLSRYSEGMAIKRHFIKLKRIMDDYKVERKRNLETGYK